jgi:hypothetical protein
MVMKLRSLIVTSILMLSVAPAAASQAGWELIGERTVERGAGRQEIRSLPIVYASHLRLCADREAIRFEDLDVFYRNGNEQQVSVQALIPAGRCTPDITLNNRGRLDIDKISLTYNAGGQGRAPRIYVFALADVVLR